MSTGAGAEAARERVRALAAAKGHAVDNAREAAGILEAAFAAGTLRRTPALDGLLADLAVALAAPGGGRLGGKSGEAARFILRALARAVDEA